MFSLTILATTDIHGVLIGETESVGGTSAPIGLARLACEVRKVRETADAVLLVDNGDMFCGSRFASACAELSREDRAAPNALTDIMNLLGYDAATLGNEDFAFGWPFLVAAMRPAGFPIVCANLHLSPAQLQQSGGLIQRSALRLVRSRNGHSLKVGLTGAVHPDAAKLNRHRPQESVEVGGIATSILSAAAELRAMGADIVVALMHVGLPRPAVSHDEDDIVTVCRSGLVDAIAAGHTHRLFPDEGDASLASAGFDNGTGTCFGIPVVMPGAWGSHLGIIELELMQQRRSWKIERCRSRLKPAGDQTDDQLMVKASPVFARLRNPVNNIAVSIPVSWSVELGMIEPSISVQIAQLAMLDYVRTAIPARVLGGRMLVAAGAPAFLRVPEVRVPILTAGALTEHDMFNLYPFENRPVLVEASGSSIRQWLEHAAWFFTEIRDIRAAQPLIRSGHASFNFDSLLGLQYEIDLMRPAGARIRNLSTPEGAMLDHDKVLVITNSYRAYGGGNFPIDDVCIVRDFDVSCRDVLTRYMQANLPVHEPVEHWTFAKLSEEALRPHVRLSDPEAARLCRFRKLERVNDEDDGLFAVSW
jgi:2',3'-cyclic-nucleotide 2'-phosphodiesterase/3'-nucleotidase